MTNWLSLFAAYRVVVIRNDEIVQGRLHPGLSPEHPEVRAALAAWSGPHFLHHADDGVEVTLVRPLNDRGRERWWLHLLLALLTLLTTTVAGAYLVGRDPVQLTWIPLGSWALPVPVHLSSGELLPGLAFSVPLLGILLAHELGHYLVARRYGMDVSPPFFIPSPHWLNLIGTFGAFIRLRSAMVNRVMLLDVGAAGPLASFALSIPAVVLGGLWSRALPMEVVPAPYVVLFGAQPVWLGNSLLFDVLMQAVRPGEGVLMLHPLAFAGWLGLFVTALNLFPLAQLDGGHVFFALLGSRQEWVARGFLGLLLLLGLLWRGWWLWAALVLVIGRGRLRHPAVFDPSFPVIGARRVVAWLCVAIFLLTFVPVPLQG